jgi:hypothetical protein
LKGANIIFIFLDVTHSSIESNRLRICSQINHEAKDLWRFNVAGRHWLSIELIFGCNS